MSQLRLHLLGAPFIEQNGNKIRLLVRKPQKWVALLTYLAIEKRFVGREELVDKLWSGNDKIKDPRGMLRTHTIYDLRRQLGDEFLEEDADRGLRLRTELIWLDVDYFNDVFRKYQNCAASALNRIPCTEYLKMCVATYTGSFLGRFSLPDEDFDAWQTDIKEMLREKFADAIEQLIAILYATNELDQAFFFANEWRKQDSDDLRPFAWLLKLNEFVGNHLRARSLSNEIIEIFGSDVWETDYSKDVRKRMDALYEAIRSESSNLSSPNKTMDILATKLDLTGLNGRSEDPTFFGPYLSILSTLAPSQPVETMKLVQEMVHILHELRDDPQKAAKALDQIEKSLTDVDKNFQVERDFYFKLQRMRIYRGLGMTNQALEILEHMSYDELLLRKLDKQTRGIWHQNCGKVLCWIKTDYSAALQHFLDAKEVFHSGGYINLEIDTNIDIGLVYWNQGKLKDAEQQFTLSKEMSEWFKDNHCLVKAIGNLGLVYLCQGFVTKAFEHFQTQLELATAFRYTKEIRRALGNRGCARYHLGDYLEAIRDIKQDIGAAKATNEGVLHANLYLARCYRAIGTEREAKQKAETVLRTARAGRLAGIKTVACRILAESSAPEVARELLTEALNDAKGKRLFDEAACLLHLAEIAENEPVRLNLHKKAIDILRNIGAEAWIEKTAAEIPAF